MIAVVGAPHAAIGQPNVLRVIIGTGLYLVLIGTTPGAIAVLVANTFVALSFAPLLGQRYAWIWPMIAGIAITSEVAGPGAASPWARTAVRLRGRDARRRVSAFRTRDA